MGKPKYMEELLSLIFLCIGSVFIVMGILSFAGVLKPSANSMVQVPALLGIVFVSVGMAFLAVKLVLKAVAAGKRKLHAELIAGGLRIDGIVERVYFQKYMQYGNRSPYRIFYSYTCQDKIFHGKSCLIWDKPDLAEGDAIEVYANESGQSTICV